MAYTSTKHGFRALVLVGAWLVMILFAWTMILSSSGSYYKKDTLQERYAYKVYNESTVPNIGEANASLEREEFHPPRSFGNGESKPPSATRAEHPPYFNPVYPVNCSAVFADDKREIARIEAMLENKRKMSWRKEISVPSDTLVTEYSEDCEFYRKDREYPTKVLSEEEKDFPLAFIILTHKNAAQVELLLRAIYQPHNVYAIHPDANSPPEFQRAIRNLARCFDNVFICSKLEKIAYAGYTRLLADINCMRDLVQHPIQWRYVINQCGEAFPLKTNLEMVRQIKAYNGHNDAEGYIAPHKLARFHRFSPKYNTISSTEERLRRYPPPANVPLYSGNAYNTFTREFIEYVLKDPVPIQFLAWINKTYSPDEHFWASLNRVRGAPGGVLNITHGDILTTFVRWGGGGSQKPCIGKYVRGICVMSTGYLSYLARVPQLFANKFHYSFDPVLLQCLQELLTNRTRDPELTEQYYPKFPKKRSWF